jgi:hypothetical protein
MHQTECERSCQRHAMNRSTFIQANLASPSAVDLGAAASLQLPPLNTTKSKNTSIHVAVVPSIGEMSVNGPRIGTFLPPADRRAHRLFGDVKLGQCVSRACFKRCHPITTRLPHVDQTSHQRLDARDARAQDSILRVGEQVQSPVAALSMSVDLVLNSFEGASRVSGQR